MAEVDDGELRFHRVTESFKTFRLAIKCIAAVLIARYGFRAFEAMAGEDTRFQFILSAVADFKFAFTLTLAGVATGWAVVERLLRRHQIRSMQERIKSFEMQLDPNRSSSGLTSSGSTNPRDRK